MSTYTREMIHLEAIAPNATENRTRKETMRIVWKWRCPGPGPHLGDVVALVNEPGIGEEDILANPLCAVCRWLLTDVQQD